MAKDLILFRAVRWSVLVVGAGLLAGCGGSGVPLAPVRGTVTKGGQPLPGVSVTFTQTEKNFSAAGLTNDKGAFVLISQSGKAGAMPGKNKVTLSVHRQEGASVVNMSDPAHVQKMMQSRGSALQGGKKGAPAAQKAEESIPPEYHDPAKSPLDYEVKSGGNDFDIAIP